MSLLALVWWCVVGSAATAEEKAPTRFADAKFCEVRTLPEIAYIDGPAADKIRHKLDLYLPKGVTEFPTLIFIHGGSWIHGDKSYFGLNKALATQLAQRGIATVLPNYRLSPAVKHPEHIKDVARAFAWTYKNIRTYGGRSDQIFVAGHSAGGHLAALLAADDIYLKAEGLNLRAIKGVIPMSGVFEIPEDVRSFERAFGSGNDLRRAASPTWQIGRRANGMAPASPPFLILFADHDFLLCGKDAAEKFCRAVQAHNGEAQLFEVRNRNHLTILINASHEEDPAGKAMIEFIQTQCAKN
jgi:acetyl esterase/lipase